MRAASPAGDPARRISRLWRQLGKVVFLDVGRPGRRVPVGLWAVACMRAGRLMCGRRWAGF